MKFYVMLQFLPNGSLLDRVRKQKRIAEAEASRLLRQSAEGLQHCHEQHVRLRFLLVMVDHSLDTAYSMPSPCI